MAALQVAEQVGRNRHERVVVVEDATGLDEVHHTLVEGELMARHALDDGRRVLLGDLDDGGARALAHFDVRVEATGGQLNQLRDELLGAQVRRLNLGENVQMRATVHIALDLGEWGSMCAQLARSNRLRVSAWLVASGVGGGSVGDRDLLALHLRAARPVAHVQQLMRKLLLLLLLLLLSLLLMFLRSLRTLRHHSASGCGRRVQLHRTCGKH